MEVKLLGMVPEVEKIIAASAKSTRSESADKIVDTLTLEEARKYVGGILAMGHESISEYAFYIFSVTGVSRVLTHQLVRHRIASYLQMSGRYTDLTDADYIVPPEIRRNEKALKIYQKGLEDAKQRYTDLLEMNIKKEDARFVLPDSISTNIVVGMNARALNNFLGFRLCNTAQWEIRELAEKILKIVKEKNPSLFWAVHRPCVIRGVCPQKPGCNYDKTPAFKLEREKYLKGYPHSGVS